MGLIKPVARPIFSIEVWPYKDRIVGFCVCNRCGEKFSVVLKGHPDAVRDMCMKVENEPALKARLIQVANAKHSCDEDSLKADPAETNRIVNKWHEYKLKAKKMFGGKA
jgi:C4-type Zn-finger protein